MQDESFELLWYEVNPSRRSTPHFLFRDKDGLALLRLTPGRADNNAAGAMEWYLEEAIRDPPYRKHLKEVVFLERFNGLREKDLWKSTGMPEELWEELCAEMALRSL